MPLGHKVQEAFSFLQQISLSSLFPRSQVLSLLFGEYIDRYAHCFELKTGNLAVNIAGNRINFLLQLVGILRHVLSRKRLIGEGHVHHRGGVSFSRGKVDQASLTKDIDLSTILGGVLIHERADQARVSYAHFLQGWDVDLHIEMARVSNNRTT